MAHEWLPADQVERWLKITTGTTQATIADDVRHAAADYVENTRPDLDYTVPEDVPERIVMAGVLAAARLYARVGSPAGLASYAEIGATEILRLDPDVSRLLETGPYQKPAVG